MSGSLSYFPLRAPRIPGADEQKSRLEDPFSVQTSVYWCFKTTPFHKELQPTIRATTHDEWVASRVHPVRGVLPRGPSILGPCRVVCEIPGPKHTRVPGWCLYRGCVWSARGLRIRCVLQQVICCESCGHNPLFHIFCPNGSESGSMHLLFTWDLKKEVVPTEERRCSYLGPTQSRTSPRKL